MITIKKYENRRLYNTAESRYVNLEEVAAMVRDGVEIQVVDAATGDDITRLILIQIIAENAKAPNSAFPLDLLRQMVVASGKLTQAGVLKYMKTMFDLYQNTYNAFAPSLAPLDVLQFMMRSRTPAATSPAPDQHEAARAPAGDREIQSDVRELQRRIEELEKLIAHSAEGKRGQKRSQNQRKKAKPGSRS